MDALLRFLQELRANVRVADLLDVAIISAFLYFLIQWLRRRGSRPMAVAVTGGLLLFFVARRFEMVLTSLLFQAGLTALLLALILVFQEDIRRMFEMIAAGFSGGEKRRPAAGSEAIEVLSEAIADLARRKIGALLVIPGREYLGHHIRGGVEVGGRISYPLIHSIFHPASPGHDGAVILEDGRVARLGVHLPLSENAEALGERGTRHAAALGLSEYTDATVVVVSEERGTISVAREGRLEPLDSPAELKRVLETEFRDRESSTRPRPRSWRRNLGAKGSAALLAVVLWLLFAYRVETVQRTFTVPVEYRNLPPGLQLIEAEPREVDIRLSGSERIFDLLNPSSLVVSLDLGFAAPTTRELRIQPQDIRRPAGLDVIQIEPPSIELSAREKPGPAVSRPTPDRVPESP